MPTPDDIPLTTIPAFGPVLMRAPEENQMYRFQMAYTRALQSSRHMDRRTSNEEVDNAGCMVNKEASGQ